MDRIRYAHRVPPPRWTSAAAAIALTLAIAASAAAQPSVAATATAAAGAAHWPVVKEGTTVKVSRHVYVIPDEHVPMVPNVGIVVGTRATLIVDPGMGLRSGEVVAREVAKVSRNAELYIANTHFHPEHTTGEAAFPRAKIVRAAAQQQDVEELGMKWVEAFARRSPAMTEILAGASFRKPDIVFEKETTLDLGGVSVRVMRLGPGHTRGDTVMLVEGDGVLFSGDLAMRNIFPAFATPQSSARTWLASLDALERLKPARVVPAHGDITDASVIGAYRDFLQALQARVREEKRAGRSADETALLLRTEFRDRYPEWAQPLRVHAAATAIYAETSD